MKRKTAVIAIALLLMITLLPADSFASEFLPKLSEKETYYTPDYRSGECILSSTKSMLRRAAIAKGSYKWDKITNTALRGKATNASGLLRHSFTYKKDGIKYEVTHQSLPKAKDDKKKELASLLLNHPEGIVVWGRNAATTGTHGILATYYKGKTLYAIDSSHNSRGVNVGIEKWTETTMKSLSYCTDIWYLCKINGQAVRTASSNEASTLSVTGVSQPETLKKGKGFPVTGSVESNYRIRTVKVAIVDEHGREVIKAEAKPNAGIFLLDKLDSAVKFGTLEQGVYTYRITASDQKKANVVLHENSFTVSGGTLTSLISLSGALRISSVKMPSIIEHGKPFSIAGKIRSGSKIKSVVISVTDASGNKVIKVKAKPRKKSFSIKKLDSKVKFGKLDYGKYTIKVRAKDSAGWKTLVKNDFIVE